MQRVRPGDALEGEQVGRVQVVGEGVDGEADGEEAAEEGRADEGGDGDEGAAGPPLPGPAHRRHHLHRVVQGAQVGQGVRGEGQLLADQPRHCPIRYGPLPDCRVKSVGSVGR